MTNQIAQLNDSQTMTTPEIAELTGKRHDNVMRVAKMLAERGIICATQIEERYNNNNLRKIYRLTKTESINLVANLSPEFTAAIIKRWQELEAQAQKPKYNLAFMERAMMNRAAIKYGYFSVIDVVSDKIICGLEQMGAVFPDKFCPDISVGILWSKYLKNTGRSPELVGAIKYRHRYPKPNPRVVDAWAYPNEMYAEFLEWLRSDWMSRHMYRYFSDKDKELMLLADQAIKTGWLPKPTFYLN